MDQEPRALIKRHNEYVREQVVHDLEALEEKLNVKRQMSEKTHAVVDKAKGTLGMNQTTPPQDAKGFVRTNAVPLAAVGLGGALLARNARQMQAQKQRFETTYPVYAGDAPVYEQQDSSGGGISSKASGMKDAATSKVSGATSTVTDKASSVKDSMSGTMSTAGSKVSDATSRASEMKDTVIERVPSRQQTVQAAKQNAPLVGIAAMAAGALAGVFLPRTRVEEERLAPLQETVMDKATEAAEGAVDKTKGALQAGAEKIGEEMGSSSSEGGISSPSGGSKPEVDPLVTTPNRITGVGATNGMYGTPAGSL